MYVCMYVRTFVSMYFRLSKTNTVQGPCLQHNMVIKKGIAPSQAWQVLNPKIWPKYMCRLFLTSCCCSRNHFCSSHICLLPLVYESYDKCCNIYIYTYVHVVYTQYLYVYIWRGLCKTCVQMYVLLCNSMFHVMNTNSINGII